MGFHNFIKVSIICQLYISINDTGKTMRKQYTKLMPNVHPTSSVKRHMSCVMCYLSLVPCHLSHETCHMSFLFDKVMELVGGGSVINGAYPV